MPLSKISAEDEIRFVLDALNIGIWKFHVQSKELFWDESMYRLFEIPSSEFSNHYSAWESSLTPEAKAQAVADLEAALEGRRDFNTTFEIETRSGKRKHIGGRGKVIRDESGMPVLMYGMNWDRTVEVESEAREQSQRNLFNAVLSHLPHMVFVKDASHEYRFTLLNHHGEALFGASESDVIGKNDFDFFPIEQAKFFVSKDREVHQSGKVLRIDREPIQTAQGPRWLRTYKVPTYHPDGSPHLLIGISSDITEEVELQEKLEQEHARSIHNAKLASLGEMSAGIAHEINNPLAIITGSLAVLAKVRHNREKFAARIASMNRGLHRIERIVKGLRKFSRSSEQSQVAPYDLVLVAQEALLLIESISKRHQVLVELQSAESAWVLCDEVEIEQVLVNLVANAIDAVKGSESPWVRLELEKKESKVVLRVIDSGFGISPEIEKKMFDPFFTTKPVGEGTGLGLSITKGILDEHKAIIQVNRACQNTCFEIIFPLHEPSTQSVA